MAATTYDIGDLVRINGTFKNNAGAEADPATVSLVLKPPTGSTVTYVYNTDAALVKSSTGVYKVEYAVTLPGTYRYRWVSTGSGATAEEGWFEVRPTRAT